MRERRHSRWGSLLVASAVRPGALTHATGNFTFHQLHTSAKLEGGRQEVALCHGDSEHDGAARLAVQSSPDSASGGG
jgi:hypothetical protein